MQRKKYVFSKFSRCFSILGEGQGCCNFLLSRCRAAQLKKINLKLQFTAKILFEEYFLGVYPIYGRASNIRVSDWIAHLVTPTGENFGTLVTYLSVKILGAARPHSPFKIVPKFTLWSRLFLVGGKLSQTPPPPTVFPISNLKSS